MQRQFRRSQANKAPSRKLRKKEMIEEKQRPIQSSKTTKREKLSSVRKLRLLKVLTACWRV